jgi:TolB protein
LRVPLPAVLAVPDFASAAPNLRQAAVDMARFIGPALQRSCQFRLFNNDEVGDKTSGIDDVPDFSRWRSRRVNIVTAGRLTELADGRIRVEARVWDVFAQVQLYGRRFTAPPGQMERLGHILAGEMFERLCGETEYRLPPD